MFGMFKTKQSSGRRHYQQPSYPAHFAPDFAVRPGNSYMAPTSAAQAYQNQTDFVMRHDHTSYNALQPFQPDFAMRPGRTYNAAQPVYATNANNYQTDMDFAPRAGAGATYNDSQPLDSYNTYGSGVYATLVPVFFVPIPSSDPAPSLHRSNATCKASTSRSHRRIGHSHGSSSHGRTHSSSSRPHKDSSTSHSSSSRHDSSHHSSSHHPSSLHRRHRDPHQSPSSSGHLHTQYYDSDEYQ